MRGKCTTFLRPRRDLLITKVRSEHYSVRCAGITTNEVLNLNKLQGNRLLSAFSLRFSFALSAVYPLSVVSEFSRESSAVVPAPRYLGRAPRTRNGDMNIPGVEYPRVVNLFGTTRMKKVRLRVKRRYIFPSETRIFGARALVRAPVGKILRLNKRQRSLPSGSFAPTFKSWELHRRGMPYAYMFLKVSATKEMYVTCK